MHFSKWIVYCSMWVHRPIPLPNQIRFDLGNSQTKDIQIPTEIFRGWPQTEVSSLLRDEWYTINQKCIKESANYTNPRVSTIPRWVYWEMLRGWSLEMLRGWSGENLKAVWDDPSRLWEVAMLRGWDVVRLRNWGIDSYRSQFKVGQEKWGVWAGAGPGW